MERKYGPYLRMEPNVVLPSLICSRPFEIQSKKNKKGTFCSSSYYCRYISLKREKKGKKSTPSGQKPPRSLHIRVYIFNQADGIETLELNQPVPGERSLANSVIFDDSV